MKNRGGLRSAPILRRSLFIYHEPLFRHFYVRGYPGSTAVDAASQLQKPLLIKGEPGTGKTLLAYEIAQALGKPLYTRHVKSTTSAQQVLIRKCRLTVSYMNQPDSLNQVAEFHRTFHAPVLETPRIPSEARCQLRVALLTEELDELREAIAQGDLVAVADALCDLQYVLSGAVLEFGLGNQFKSLFDEVQRSNMSKACLTVAEAQATVDAYQAKGVPCHFIESDGKFLVYRDADHKTLKSVNYSPADLAGVLQIGI